MLNILRKNAQSIIVQAIVVIIAIVFIFWGVGTNLNDKRGELAVVNGKELSYRDFQQRYEQTVEGLKQRLGGQVPPGLIEGLGIKQQVLDQLVQAELLRQGAQKIGIVISKEAIQEKILAMGAFTKNGRFDQASYKAVLEQNRLSPTTFEASIHDDLLLNRAIEAIGAFAGLSEQHVREWLEYTGLEIKIAYGAVKSEAYVDKVQVADTDLVAWFDKVKDNYKTAPETRLQYLFFPYSEDLKQVAITDEMVRRYYQDHLSAYAQPEQRRARHILFKVAEGDAQETRAAKKADADKVLTLLGQGQDFAQLAGRYSDDTTKAKGGDLGFFSRGMMTPAFEERAFALKKGEVSGVVETPFGYHIIKLEEIKPEKIQTVDEVSTTIRSELEKQGVKAITFKKASGAYEEIIRAGSLAKYSAASGVPISRTDFFTRNSPPKEGFVNDPALLKAAFGLRKGELSSIVETAKGYAILFVDDFKEAVVPELAAVRQQATADYKKEKSVELARAAAEELLKTAREKQSWPAALEKKETGYLGRTEASAAVPNEVRQAAFTHAGREVFPEQVIAVGTAYYIYQIVDFRQGKKEMEADQRQALEQQLLAAQKNKLMVDWLAQLRKEAKIWINPNAVQ